MSVEAINAKKVVVEEITGKFNDSQSAVVVEYRGLSVAEVTELRKALREEDVEFKVYKNKLVQRATESAGYAEINDKLVGPNAIAFGHSDAVAPARVLANFAKDHEALVIKAGIVEGKVLEVEEINEIAKLPGREGMYSMLLGMLQAPVSKFARVVKAVADAREENGGEAPVEAPAEEKVEEAIEEKFDVTAAAPVAVAAAADAGAAAEPTEVNVTLTEVGGTKVAVIKAVREITGLGLVDAKGLVDKAPSVIKEKVSADEAKEIKEKLEAAGATVEVK